MATDIVDHHFNNKTILEKGTYEACQFSNCDFKDSDLSEYVFIDCEFNACDLSNIKNHQLALRNVVFTDCKLLGIHFEQCNPFLFEVSFKACQLQFSTFYRCDLKGVRFIGCDLKNVDFAEAILSKSDFSNSDLEGATFENTGLSGADFSSASNFLIDPDTNKVDKAIFSISGLPGLLTRYDIEVV